MQSGVRPVMKRSKIDQVDDLHILIELDGCAFVLRGPFIGTRKAHLHDRRKFEAVTSLRQQLFPMILRPALANFVGLAVPFCLKDGRRRPINLDSECRYGIGHVMTRSETRQSLE